MEQRNYPAHEKKILFEIFKAFIEVCEELNLTYSISSGTLLGAVRTGKFIPWDYDIDVCLHDPGTVKLEEMTQRMIKREYYPNFKGWDTHCIKYVYKHYKKNPDAFIPTLDVYLIKQFDDTVWKSTSEKCRLLYPKWDFPTLMYLPLKKIKFEDMMVWGPAKPEKLLKRYYGKRWNINDNNYGPPNNELGSKMSF